MNMSYTINGLATNNFLIKHPDGTYDTNKYGELIVFLADVVFNDGVDIHKSRWHRFQSTPVKLPVTKELITSFCTKVKDLCSKLEEKDISLISEPPKVITEIQL